MVMGQGAFDMQIYLVLSNLPDTLIIQMEPEFTKQFRLLIVTILTDQI